MNGNKLQSTYDGDYHDRQFAIPYQSTISFCDWLVGLGTIDERRSRICDLGCGKGANLLYMARRFPHCSFAGLDINEQLVRAGSELLRRASVANCQLSAGDLHNAGSYFGKGEFDGVISLQTLSWLPGYDRAIDAIVSLSPKWIALTSLFFDGPIDTKTVISEFDPAKRGEAKRSFWYNTYSLPSVKQYLFDRGYKQFKHIRFDIPIDLPRPVQGKMQTYTELTTDGRRLQISGPLLMNWHFIYAALES
jgi:ubiquinone/menaquinone biosynthesis C-methylase UbiE